MSDFRRHGEIVGFWGTLASDGVTPQAAAVLANGLSNGVYLDQAVNSFGLLLSVNAATTISLLAAHSSQLNSEGDEPDHTTAPASSLFYPVQWNGTVSSITFSGAGSAYVLVPDFVPGWVMLKSSGAANIIGGYEAVVGV